MGDVPDLALQVMPVGSWHNPFKLTAMGPTRIRIISLLGTLCTNVPHYKRVYKFKANRRVFLLAYTIEGDSVVLFQVGPHENFYRDLKRYLKGMGN
jgi:hypothetical protein